MNTFEEMFLMERSSIEQGFGWIEATQLVKASWNYKLDSQELKEKLKANIKRNGLIENIIVRELETGFFEIVNGNHRMDAVSELGIQKLFCFNLGTISQAQAMRVAIETNETRFTSDQEQMAARIREIIEVFDRSEFIQTAPFTDQQLDQILNLPFTPDDPNEHWEGMPEFGQGDLMPWKQLTINFSEKSDYEDFSKLVGQTLTDKTKSIWYPEAESESTADKKYASES